PLPAGELVRKAVRVLRAQADRAQQLVDAAAALASPVQVVHAERLRDDLPHGHARVERRVRVLKDDLQLPAHFAHPPSGEARDVLPVEDDLSVGRLEELDHGAAERRLSAAGLADEAERLPRAQREIDAVDGVHLADAPLEDAGHDREVLEEPLDAEDLTAFGGPFVNLLFGRLPFCRLAHVPAPTGSAKWPTRPSSSSAKWQAVRCTDSSICLSSGSSSRQRTRPCERKQRGWNGHPGGRLIRLGGWPGIGRSHSSSAVSFGRLSISPIV